jgi:hypothetical protein
MLNFTAHKQAAINMNRTAVRLRFEAVDRECDPSQEFIVSAAVPGEILSKTKPKDIHGPIIGLTGVFSLFFFHVLCFSCSAWALWSSQMWYSSDSPLAC